MNFGVPSQRVTKKEEQFPETPVLTIGIDGGKGTSKGMFLNSKAVEALGLGEVEATIAFSFDGGVFITNGNNPSIPDEYKIRVTKGNPRKVSEKRTYEYISNKVFNLNNDVENHFELEKCEIGEGGIQLFQLKLITEETSVKEESIGSDDEIVATEVFKVDTEEIEVNTFN